MQSCFVEKYQGKFYDVGDLDVLDINKFGLFSRGWKEYVPRMCVTED